jgi:uncharacterized protein YecE (DUF72 family)
MWLGHGFKSRMSRQTGIFVGTAGWSLPKQHADAFPPDGSHLERYAARLTGVEINTSFYRPHRVATYERWAASVPPDFRFAVKVPRTITHERRLVDIDEPLTRFLAEVAGLGTKLGPILLQLPPSLAFEPARDSAILARLRRDVGGDLVCEPRHPSWFTPSVEARLDAMQVARVAADPAPAPGAAEPGGWRGMAYYRLHGSPEIYRSAYAPAALLRMAERLAHHAARAEAAWCIFDNTAEFHAAGDALTTLRNLARLDPGTGG